ncbi:MAG TPA: hypothetical protein VJN43_23980 [Bryobacteraceae bacterium]|nr:hypothetical protein [Bryobacteraceae bacterium]
MSLIWMGEAAIEPAQEERRAANRTPVRCPLRLEFQDLHGKDHLVRVRALNVSQCGTMIQSLRPIPVGTPVRVVRGNGAPLGNTRVRHCSWRGWGFKIGLEFATYFVGQI